MTFTRTWNASYEASPAGTDYGYTADNRIREMKSDIRERMETDHYMDIAGTDAEHGEHKQVTLRVGEYAGSGTADKAVIHAVDVGGKARPCYYDEDSTLLRMVALPGGGVTKTLFIQAAAPLGWTQDTTNNDAFLRIVSTSGGGTGGTTGARTLGHVHAMSTHYHTMGTHNHKVYDYVGSSSAAQVYNSSGSLTTLTYGAQSNGANIASPTAGVAISIDLYSSNTDPGNTSSADPGDTNSTAIYPKYVDGITCSLD